MNLRNRNNNNPEKGEKVFVFQCLSDSEHFLKDRNNSNWSEIEFFQWINCFIVCRFL